MVEVESTRPSWRYAAFISYSNKDERFARRLHRSLENFRIPLPLISLPLSVHPKGKDRLYPCFLDREELASGILSESIEMALRESGALIVVCSPASAVSKWVEREIRFYESLGRANRIFAVIASGEPSASVNGTDSAECFPLALRTADRLQAGDRAALEIGAGDARRGFDGFRRAWLKILAGILNVNVGSLVDRDLARRRRQLVIVSMVGGLVTVAISVLTTGWILQVSRADSENRTRLTADMRAAFEIGDPVRGIAILAHLYADMTPEDKAKNTNVLSAWLPHLYDRAAALAKIDEGSVFRASDRLFLKEHGTVRALPFDTQTAVAVSASGTVFALDRSGKLWQESAGNPPEEIGLSMTLDPNVIWQAGRMNGDLVSFVGAAPANDDYDDEDDTRAAPEQVCATIDTSSGNVALSELEFSREPHDDGTPCGLRSHLLSTNYIDINASPEFELPERIKSEGAPTPTDIDDLRVLCSTDEYSPCGSGESFHFGSRGLSPPVLVRTHSYGDAGFANVDVCTLLKSETLPVCVSPGVRKIGVRVFDNFVYLADWAYEADQPMFRLVDRRDASVHEFSMQEFRGKTGGSPSYVAVSASEKELAMVVDDEIFHFEIGNAIVPKFVNRFSRDGLRGSAKFGALEFINESTVVVSRSSGLTLAYDLETGAERWRFRLPSTHESFDGSNVHTAISSDRTQILISGDYYAAVLDTLTGLPVRQTLVLDFIPRSMDEDLYKTESEYNNTSDDAAAKTLRSQWREALIKVSQPVVTAESGGGFIVNFNENDVWRFSPIERQPASTWMIATARCRTGWEVQGGNLVPFDFLEWLKPSMSAIGIVDLSARCEK